MYTIALKADPSMVYGYCDRIHINTFDCAEVITPLKFHSKAEAQNLITREYKELKLDTADAELFIYPEIDTYKYIVVYNIPRKSESTKSICTTRYVLQENSSLIHSARSTNARKFDSEVEARSVAKAFGILVDSFIIENITEEF